MSAARGSERKLKDDSVCCGRMVAPLTCKHQTIQVGIRWYSAALPAGGMNTALRQLETVSNDKVSQKLQLAMTGIQTRLHPVY